MGTKELVVKFHINALELGWNNQYPDVGCGGLFEGASGWTTSSNYPADYNANELCEWFLAGVGGRRVAVQFLDLHVEKDFDFVSVYDGFSSDAPLLFQYSGQSSHLIVQSSGLQVRVRFQSDYRDQFRGFNLTWNTID